MKLHSFLPSFLPSFLIIISSATGSGQTDWKLGGNTTTTDSKLGTNSGYDLIIETANTERLRITDFGNVGIGITYPESKLHVLGDFTLHGTMRLTNFPNSTSSAMRLMYLDEANELRLLQSEEFFAEAYRYDCKTELGGSYPAPLWKSAEGIEFGTLCTGFTCPARVGIGLSTPGCELQVAGTTTTEQLLVGEYQSDLESHTLLQCGYFDISESQYKSSLNLRRKQGMSLFYEMSEGIFPIQVRGFNQTENTFRLHQQGILDINYFGQGDELVFNIFDQTLQSPIAALTTDGVWYCQGVVVKHVPFWPDYVFKDDYHLRPLGELNDYIKTNGHLPNVPTEAEIAENGVNLTDMIIVLTEKVEELTLYTIQQQKEIEDLRLLLSNKGGDK